MSSSLSSPVDVRDGVVIATVLQRVVSRVVDDHAVQGVCWYEDAVLREAMGYAVVDE